MSNKIPPPLIDATAHSNDLTFSGMSSADFSLHSHSITSGQPFDGVKSIGGGTIRVTAGRKKSSGVADWFNAQPSGAKLPTHTELHAPDSLNFAMSGTLTLNDGNGPIVCPNFVIAQGNYGSVNYWWITAPGMVETDYDVQYLGKAGTLQCTQNGRAVQVHFTTESQSNANSHTIIVKVTH
ncbi:hypothetical protein ACN28E_06730 [Archangium lansingense]|uniref:hypothetical protein n=1 Tax=Archangium lansingense TaxID=2995310 RepID=UPI003B79E5FF